VHVPTALATEMPTPELLLERPHGRAEPLISRRMWKHVIVQGCYQLFWLFLIIYGAPAQLPAFAVCAAYIEPAEGSPQCTHRQQCGMSIVMVVRHN
jgi:hypothetical protein